MADSPKCEPQPLPRKRTRIDWDFVAVMVLLSPLSFFFWGLACSPNIAAGIILTAIQTVFDGLLAAFAMRIEI